MFLVGVAERAIRQPFWYDEQWRAYFVSVRHGWWAAIAKSNAPMSAGWYVSERFSMSVLGDREWVLRFSNLGWALVMAIATFALARRWMGSGLSTFIAALVMLNSGLLYYAIQFKPFVADAAGTVVAVAALMWARTARSTRQRVAGFVLASLALTTATPAVFVVVPLLAYLLLGWFREGRKDRVLLIGCLATLLVGAVHLRFFVMRQNTLSSSNYWNANFAPHSSISALWHFVGKQTQTYVPGFLTSTYLKSKAGGYPVQLTHGWNTAVAASLWLLLALGAYHAAKSGPGRMLLIGVAASFPITLVASWLRLWPYGFVRTNYYIVPLLYVLCAIGFVRAVTAAMGAARRSGQPWQEGAAPGPRPRIGGPWFTRHGPRAAAVAVGAAASLAALVAALVAGSMAVGVLRGGTQPSPLAYGRTIESAVDDVRANANATTAVVVAGPMAYRGWQYYMFFKSGMPGVEVPQDRTEFVRHGDPRLGRLRADHPGITSVFYYMPMGSTGASLHADESLMLTAGFCPQGRRNFAASGLLVRLAAC